MEKQYDVFEDKVLIFTGNEEEANMVFTRMNTVLEHKREVITMLEHNKNIEYTPWYDCYDEFINEYHTSNIMYFRHSFHTTVDEHPYKYDLDWVYIQQGAIITNMFLNIKFCKKLPRIEANISFNEFVKRTKLIVTPELLTNNDMDVKEWCNDKNNQKLMKTNRLYEPMLRYWLDSDFITIEEKFNVIQEINIQVFDI